MRKVIENICRELMTVNLLAKVTAVDKRQNTCNASPLNGGAELLDVLLKADDGKTKGQIVYPAVGSLVLVAPLDNDQAHYFVVMFSEVEEVICEIENTRLISGKNGVTIARGKDGLQEILTDLINQILKIYAPKDTPGLIAIQKRIKQILNGA